MTHTGIVICLCGATLWSSLFMNQTVCARDLTHVLRFQHRNTTGITQDEHVELPLSKDSMEKLIKRDVSRFQDMPMTSNPFDEDFVCNMYTDTIVGGTEVDPYSLPWMAYIITFVRTGAQHIESAQPLFRGEIFHHPQTKHGNPKQAERALNQLSPKRILTKFQCAGTVISDRWLLSAGHCFQVGGRRFEKAYITLAVHNILNRLEEKALIFTVLPEDVFFHDEYVEETFTHDIVMIRLPSRIRPRHPHIRPACLSIDGKGPEIGTFCTASGWGVVEMGTHLTSHTLLSVQLMITYCGPNSEAELCTTRPSNVSTPQDSCIGDSGGPLIWKRGEKSIIVGVLSAGSEQCDGDPRHVTTMYMKVTYYFDWMKKVLKKASATPDRRKVTSFPCP